MKIAHSSRDLFMVFDSHPRTAHPSGAAFFFSGNLESVAQYLSDLFPVDARFLSGDSGLQWQAELLAHVSGHFFECSRNDMAMSKAVERAFIDANCALLLSKAQESEAHSRHKLLAAENERLKKDIVLIEERTELMKHELSQRAVEQEELRELREAVLRTTLDRDPVRQSSAHTWKNAPGHRSSKEGTLVHDIPHAERSRPPFGESPPFTFQSNADIPFSKISTARSGKGKAVENQADDDIEVAVRMQLEYQMEDAALAEQMQHLQATFVQKTFDCRICMDELPIDDIVRMETCEHTFCRACIRQYVTSKLNDRKYPMPCPCCSTSKDGSSKASASSSAYMCFSLNLLCIPV